MEREVGGGIGMGNTCKPMAVSFQCMTKSTTNKKKNKKDYSFCCFTTFFFIVIIVRKFFFFLVEFLFSVIFELIKGISPLQIFLRVLAVIT